MHSWAAVRTLFALAVRYAVAGAVNSVVGLITVIALDQSRWVGPAIANGCGFAMGLGLGFMQHRRIFTAERTRAENARYLGAITVAFALNQVALWAALMLMPAATSLAAQAVGIVAYGCTLFLLSRYWVFRAPVLATVR